MKVSVIVAGLLSAIATSAPTAEPEADALAGLALAQRTEGMKADRGPIPFTSTFRITAFPRNVVDSNNMKTGGQKGAIGYFDYGINSDYNLICYHIRLCGFGHADYSSPAKTATHIHQANAGLAGPPRIAFPNPQPVGNNRLSVGCLQGPFTTGVISNDTGLDTGAGFHIRQLEQNPTNFFTDTHTTVAVPGAVRGQFGKGRGYYY